MSASSHVLVSKSYTFYAVVTIVYPAIDNVFLRPIQSYISSLKSGPYTLGSSSDSLPSNVAITAFLTLIPDIILSVGCTAIAFLAIASIIPVMFLYFRYSLYCTGVFLNIDSSLFKKASSEFLTLFNSAII